MADPLLEGAKRLSDAATPGPWYAEGPWIQRTADQFIAEGYDDERGLADAEFIARARTLIPELVERVEQAELRLKLAEDVRLQMHGPLREKLWEALAAHHQPSSERGETAG